SGLPIRDNVVVDLFTRRNLDELDVALAPISVRLHPERWMPLEVRVRVLIVLEAPFALDQTKALGIVIDERGHLRDGARVRQRPPDALAAPRQPFEPVRVVDGAAGVVAEAAVLNC